MQHTCAIYFNPAPFYSQEITRTSIKIDRIKQILERTESDTVRVLQLQNWSDIIFYSDPDLHLKLQTDIVIYVRIIC